ncbi:MAG TPA: glycosyltransferase family 39 protein [Aggregatilinea sp.]|uniref:ArnT family glycosyltransferase n=1 Tax=Aggregatilinea sp. TaxID=2806333 RepID=UPI002CEB654A|nr:glycosyltransferase family 39 protein [Aggregatilinea sp.]HML23827.1 glycosyltransferase family 39 protein [Aggregatilinea sp.]
MHRYLLLWAAAAIILFTLISALPQVPSAIPQGRDSGIYAYISWMAEKGVNLYRDVWADNKPPALYYVNAFAFAIFGPDRWALWFANALLHLATVATVFAVLQAVYRRSTVSLTGAMIYAVLARHPALIIDGNLTESYALLPQALCMAAGYWFLHRPSDKMALAVGITASVAFMTRQTSIGAPMMLIPAVLAVRHPVLYDPKRWRWLALMIAGGVGGLVVLVGHLWLEGALSIAIDAMVNVPFEFHRWVDRKFTPAWATVFTTVTSSNFWLAMGAYVPFALGGLALAARHTVSILNGRIHHADEAATRRTWEVWIALTFIADLALANSTNKSHGHYFLSPMLALSFMIAAGLVAMFDSRRRTRWVRWGKHIYWVLAMTVAIVIQVLGYKAIDSLSESKLAGKAIIDPLPAYVAAHTDPDDMVFGWGVGSSRINFQAGRLSPTRFHYGYPLIVPDAPTQARIEQTVKDLERNKPVMVIDTTFIDGKRVPPLDPERRIAWWALGGRRDVANLQPIFHFVADYCELVDRVENADIYTCRYDGDEKKDDDKKDDKREDMPPADAAAS